MLAEYLKIDEKAVFYYYIQNPFQVAENSPGLPSGQQRLGVPEIRTLNYRHDLSTTTTPPVFLQTHLLSYPLDNFGKNRKAVMKISTLIGLYYVVPLT